jgi:hypothetical protein
MQKTLLAAFTAAALTAGTAIAQPSPPPGMDPAQVASSRADDMTLLLGLRPDQRPALDAFLGRIAPPPPGDGDRHGAPDGSRMQAMMEAAQQYRANLSPDQQARFDALERLRHGMGRMGGHGRWGAPPPQQ